MVPDRQVFPADSSIPVPVGTSSWKGDAGQGSQGSDQHSPAEAGAFGIGACAAPLPGVVFLSGLRSWSKPFEEKQGEAALPAQTKASTVACFFSVELINTKNK